MAEKFPPEGWITALLDNFDKIATWGNHEKTKILVISHDIEKEKRFVEENLKTKNIPFEYFEITDRNGQVQNEKEFMDSFEKWAPTIVVLAYHHDTKTGKKKKHNHSKDMSVTNILETRGHFSNYFHPIHPNYLFIETRNVWHLEKCILTSKARTTNIGVRDQLEKAMEDGILVNSEDTRVLILSGGHGTQKKDGRVLSAGGRSCFSQMDKLVYAMYEEDCKTIGIDPDADICFDYDRDDIPRGINQKEKPKPGPKQKSQKYKKNKKNKKPLLDDKKFSKIQFDVLNIAYFGTYDIDSRQAKIAGLMEYIEDFRPTFICIGWCFSSNGDLAVAFRSYGIFSKLLLEHDLRIISNDPKAKLSEQQVLVLKMAALGVNGQKQFKDFHLAGRHGSGKTLLGVEITKMLLAQLLHEGKKINLLIFAKKNKHHRPNKLVAKLKEDVKEIIEAYPDVKLLECQVLQDMDDSMAEDMMDGFTVEQVAQEIKKRISQMNEDSEIIIFTDEVSTTLGKDIDERNFESMTNMGPNVRSIYAHSPISNIGPGNKHSKFNLRLPTTVPNIVYSVHLHTLYRNNNQIFDFLQFYTENDDFGLTDILLSPNAFPGDSLPPALPGSPHPVLWLDCNWDWDHMDKIKLITVEMIENIVLRAGVNQINKDEISRLIIHHYSGVVDKLNCCVGSECVGIEAEIVIAVCGADAWMIEALSRARRQLVIISGKEIPSFMGDVFLKAEEEKLLCKGKIPCLLCGTKEEDTEPEDGIPCRLCLNKNKPATGSSSDKEDTDNDIDYSKLIVYWA